MSAIENFRIIPDDFIILIKEEAKIFANTPELKAALEELQNAKATYANDQEALEAIKAKSEDLYMRYNFAVEHLKDSTEGLTENTKNFMKEHVLKMRALRPKDGEKWTEETVKTFGKEAFAKFQELSESEQKALAGDPVPTEEQSVGKLWDMFNNMEEKFVVYNTMLEMIMLQFKADNE
uniref:M3 family oligoendopeptidase n=1 Tax=Steinernema glaseri TaxID=37863 RepID=A0A1I7ZIQ8_9BILA